MIYVLNNGNFGKNVRILRNREKMSQKTLSEILDTSPELLEEIEQGNQLDIEYEMMETLVKVFHTDVGKLTGTEMHPDL